MRFLLSLLAGAAALAAQAQPPAAHPSVRLLVQNSLLAGFRYAEAAQVWPQLNAGDALDLVREPDNPHDANAVRVEWRGRKLGYVPRAENGALAWAMDRGEPLRARVSRLAEHRNPRRRIEFEVYIE
jgi:HIRAN domain-containing protein